VEGKGKYYLLGKRGGGVNISWEYVNLPLFKVSQAVCGHIGTSDLIQDPVTLGPEISRVTVRTLKYPDMSACHHRQM